MAISPGPAGLKFWRAPGLSADNTADIDNLPASVGNQFNPWGPRRPVQDWVMGVSPLYMAAPFTLPGAAGSYSLTGSDANLALRLAADAGSYSLTGAAAGLVIPGDTTNLPAGGANWFNPWGPKRPVQDWFRGPIPAVPVILTAAASSYTLTGGSAVTFAFGQAAAAGAYTLTGSSAALALGHVAGSGSYTLSGSNAALALRLGAGAGSYTITGTAATLVMPFSLSAVAGSYTLTGAAASFVIPGVVTYLPAGMTGGYVPWRRPFPVNLRTSTGRPLAEAELSVTLTAAGGSYTITGTAAALTVASPPDTTHLPAGAVNWFNPWGRRFPINLRTSTGRPLAPAAGTTLTAAAGAYTITGANAALALRLTANSGSYTVSGTAAVLARGFAAGAGAYAITGTDANLVQAGTITLTCGSGSYLLTGGATVSFVSVAPPTEQPGGGYTGGVSRVGRGRMIRRRKRGELDLEPPDLEPPPLSPSPPDLKPPTPGPKPPDLLPPQPSLLASMPQVKPAKILKRKLEDDEDEDEIALLLELLSRL